MTKDEFKEWADKLKAGDHGFTVYLLSAYGRKCEQHLMKKFECRLDEATDILMDIVIDLIDKIVRESIEELKNPGGYLLKACEYRYLLLYKKRKKSREKKDDLLLYYYGEIYDERQLEQLFDSEWLEEIEQEKMRTIKRILAAFQLLNEKCRQILELFYVDNKSMKEISEIMHFASSNVSKTTKNRCLKKWRSHIEELTEVEVK
jgi:RNA polymerase sigma factor (sigma-70 family)